MSEKQFNTCEEERLIEAAKNGESAAFGEIVKLYEKLVYNSVRLKISSAEDALDVSQNVFIKLWRSIGSYRGDCRFSTWVYKICQNACLDFLRHQKATATEAIPTYTDKDGDEIELEFADESVGASPERMAERREKVMLVRDAMTKLSPDAREIIVLRDMEGYSYEAIAEMKGLEVGTVKSRLNRARLQLKAFLSEVYVP